jgi:3'(2'), 5'-bisphosphate nucleotidase
MLTTERFTIIASKSHLSPETKEIIEACKKRYMEVDIISCGSSKKLCFLAEGKVNLYPRIAPTMEWDTAAAHAIVKAAGREIVDFNSKEELRYNKQNLLNPFFMAYDSKFHLND